ncbi:uncharacterized protein LOC8070245 [Sorghum bicolor]|uniref:Neprosin PEP catalytic domain-containing protein n=2 Tax=Sorghum bicolor TaxID=4558 RepID=A0A1Z5RKX4_SORBI|nr:uncharacterized protein LOC8070245 [Sorghum bicolor]OQU84026.1 hypothetical protein SORBI_3005G217766 [Sorghum bicolor]|eukprot:XP_002450001.2 uncharacterized protein LOC8070245 [Sorghum bicolor]
MASTRVRLVATLIISLVLLALEAAAARQLSEAPLTSIQSPDGDIIDCVHITKQPAFDHPLLKNHVIQMRPSDYPISHYDESSIITHPFTQTWHQNGECPENTIPIRRTKDEDILKASSIRKYGKMMPIGVPNLMSVEDPQTSNQTKGHQHAVASAWGNDKYYGTQATFNLWQPTVESAKHFSLAQLWITSGSYQNNDLNTIEAGWQVFPNLYNDSNARLFIYWTNDAYDKTGCYNLCPGFIQTNNQIAIGGSISQLSPVSIYAGLQYDITILVWKGRKDGNWWLKVGSYVLGYWPPSIFTNLANSAESIQWGGEVYSPNPASQTSTDMGSGHFPEEGFGKASYIRNIQVVDSFNSLISPNDVALGGAQRNCYRVLNGTARNWGTYIFYGGPGKNPNCP